MFNRDVVIVDGVRTAFGKQGGVLRTIVPAELSGMAIKGLCDKTQILEKAGSNAIDAVFAGSAYQDVNCINFARYATLAAGLPYETAATFIEMQCGSSIAAINAAALQVKAGIHDIVIAGGGESWSQMYRKYSTAVEPYKAIPPTPAPLKLAPKKEDDMAMIAISDNMAKIWGVTREEADAFAYDSQIKAAKAIDAGYFKEEIIPIEVKYSRKADPVTVDQDEHPRRGTTLEGLAKLKPVFEGGVTTPGNASGLNDGAAFVLIMTAEKAAELGYHPMARWILGIDTGVDPKVMGIGPAYSNMKLLQKAGMKVEDIDMWECNEAFAAQNLSVIRQMEEMSGVKIDMKKWNPYGGAIAFGHPNGASGGRIAIANMKALIRSGGRYGIFGACIGGGLGASTLIENIYDGGDI